MASVTLAQLRARVRELADMVGSDFVTDTASSLDGFINAAIKELYDLLLLTFEDYALTSQAFTTVSGTGTYDLPADFFKLDGVDLTINGRVLALRKFNFQNRNDYDASVQRGTSWPKYRLENNSLRLRPAPQAVYSGTIWYRPIRSALGGDTDELDGVNGWEDYVIVTAAIRCLQKEESDPSALFAMKAEIKQRIQEAAKDRDVGEATHIVDVDDSRFW